MTPEVWQGVFAGTAVLVPVVLAWTASSGVRAKRHGEQAQLGFELARELRTLKEAEDARRLTPGDDAASTSALVARMDQTARFMAAEYSRLLLRDGWNTATIALFFTYGLGGILTGLDIGVAAEKDGNVSREWFAFGILVIGFALLLVSVGAWIAKVIRRRRLRAAGIRVATPWQEIRETLHWLRVSRLRWQAKQAARRALRS